jgi:hypothetical protein
MTQNISCTIQQEKPNAKQISYKSTILPMAPVHRGLAQHRIKPAGLLQEQNLSYHKFHYWRKKLETKEL